MKTTVGDKEVYAISKEECEGLILEKPHVVISINDPHAKPPLLMPSRWRAGTLCLWFEDRSGAGAMTDEDAKRIWKFVESAWENVSAVVVHCSMGHSRGPAIAAAITRVKGGQDEAWFTNCSPSKVVYHKMMSAAVDERILKS